MKVLRQNQFSCHRLIPCRDVNIVCGDKVSVNMTRGIDHLRNSRTNKVKIFELYFSFIRVWHPKCLLCKNYGNISLVLHIL